MKTLRIGSVSCWIAASALVLGCSSSSSGGGAGGDGGSSSSGGSSGSGEGCLAALTATGSPAFCVEYLSSSDYGTAKGVCTGAQSALTTNTWVTSCPAGKIGGCKVPPGAAGGAPGGTIRWLYKGMTSCAAGETQVGGDDAGSGSSGGSSGASSGGAAAGDGGACTIPATVGGSCDGHQSGCNTYWGGSYTTASAVGSICSASAPFVAGGCPAAGVIGYCVANNGVGNYAQYVYVASQVSFNMTQCSTTAHGTWCTP